MGTAKNTSAKQKNIKKHAKQKNKSVTTVSTFGKKQGIRQKMWETPKNNHFNKNCAKNQPNNKQKHTYPPLTRVFIKTK